MGRAVVKNPSPLASPLRFQAQLHSPGIRDGWVGLGRVALGCLTLHWHSTNSNQCAYDAACLFLPAACLYTHVILEICFNICFSLRACHCGSVRDAYTWVCMNFCVLCLCNCLRDFSRRIWAGFYRSALLNSSCYGEFSPSLTLPGVEELCVGFYPRHELQEWMRKKNGRKGISVPRCLVLFFPSFFLPVCPSHLIFLFWKQQKFEHEHSS